MKPDGVQRLSLAWYVNRTKYQTHFPPLPLPRLNPPLPRKKKKKMAIHISPETHCLFTYLSLLPNHIPHPSLSRYLGEKNREQQSVPPGELGRYMYMDIYIFFL